MSAESTDRLRQAGMRVTVPRRTVLDVLAEHPHSTAADIETYAIQRIGHVSTQAIYDVLSACTQAGLLRRIEPAGSPARYETRTGDNHHHAVCRACGDVHDVDCVVGTQPCLTPATGTGFDVTEAEVVFWGYCPRCREHSPRQ